MCYLEISCDMITEKDLQVCILRRFVDFTNVVRSIYFCQFVRRYGTSAKDYTNIDIKNFMDVI